MINRKFGILLSLVLAFLSHANAQTSDQRARSLFERFDVSVSAGTTGLGIDLSTPLASWCRARVGFDYMPHFNVPMTFDLQSFTEDGKIGNDFSSLQPIITQFTGITVDQSVKMEGHGRFADFTLMLDFFPIPNNKHWIATAGFYWGASKIGHVQNTIQEAPTLVGVLLYNNMYEYFVNERYIDEPIYNDIYIDFEVGDALREKFLYYGRVGVNMGKFKDTGLPYIMEPDVDGMVKADMYVNSFKPYLGLGYETALDKNKKWNFGVNVGCLFWGGTPRILTHDMRNGNRIDIGNDVDNVPGKVGNYVDIATHLKVYPSVGLRLSYRIL